MGWLVGLIVIGVIGWWLFGKKNAPSPAPVITDAPAPPRYQDYRDELERKPIDELDEEERIIRRAHDAFEHAKEERTAEYRAKQQALASDQDKIRRATDFIRTSHLDLALPYMQDKTQHWPSWSKMDESRWTAPLPLSDVDGTTSGGYDKKAVQFRADGSALYRIEFERSRVPSDDDWEYASMTLFVEGEEVLGMFTKRKWTQEFDTWKFAVVESLKVGPWIEEFIALYNRLRSIDEHKSEDQSNDWVRSQAAKIDIGNVA